MPSWIDHPMYNGVIFMRLIISYPFLLCKNELIFCHQNTEHNSGGQNLLCSLKNIELHICDRIKMMANEV